MSKNKIIYGLAIVATIAIYPNISRAEFLSCFGMPINTEADRKALEQCYKDADPTYTSPSVERTEKEYAERPMGVMRTWKGGLEVWSALPSTTRGVARNSTFDKFIMASVACNHIRDFRNLICVRKEMGEAAFNRLFNAQLACQHIPTNQTFQQLACLKRKLDY